MRKLITALNVTLVVFGVAAAFVALDSQITLLAAILGAGSVIATGLTIVLNAWETYLDTPYGGIRLEEHEPILFTPRRGLPGPNGIPTQEKANFWKWLFGKRSAA